MVWTQLVTLQSAKLLLAHLATSQSATKLLLAHLATPQSSSSVLQPLLLTLLQSPVIVFHRRRRRRRRYFVEIRSTFFGRSNDDGGGGAKTCFSPAPDTSRLVGATAASYPRTVQYKLPPPYYIYLAFLETAVWPDVWAESHPKSRNTLTLTDFPLRSMTVSKSKR